MTLEGLATILLRTLYTIAETRSVSTMTTNCQRITQVLTSLIENHADFDEIPSKRATTDYIENVIDNGWIGPGEDTLVWELIELLGYDRNQMDPFAVFAEIVTLIDAC